MAQELSVSIGHYSDKGRKEVNQDFHGALFPDGPTLGMKGIAIALADGISSSLVSQIAAESTIKSFLTDYYCTSETWTVKTSVQRVIAAINSWLYAETKRSQHAYDMDKGYVCTLSAMVLKSRSAHIFHVGDGRIYRLSGSRLEQLTNDHRSVISAGQSYLSRAIGMAQNVEIDYRMLEIDLGDIFVLTTDGVYEHTDGQFVNAIIQNHPNDLDMAARLIAEDAYSRGSTDNLTIQIARIDDLPDGNVDDIIDSGEVLPAPPLLEARQAFEGYRILRQIHASSRSHIYLASDIETSEQIALKIPSIDLRDDIAYLKRFIMEEWIARRLNSAHVLKAVPQTRRRNFAYVVTEFVDGQTLSQWMRDNPNPNIETVRGIIEQIAKGLRAFHRKEMMHQDLRPENIMIDKNGTVKIIDFGSAQVAGVVEAGPTTGREDILGTLQFTAPEYFVGDVGTRRSDFFSLGVITYQMLTGKLPYGTQVAKIRTSAQQRKLRYISARGDELHIPDWIDGALKKAVHPYPFKRYETLSEFIADLRTPNKNFVSAAHVPLAQRNPVALWQSISLILAIFFAFLLVELASLRSM
ncbi:MAG: bifunctional protein-serine/threonine kinase/phosphatase [Alphaproteobacteria bacterium]|nr:bifunctional protein-serine/threonine kinase/phosphatase [Alphaproteobacteria bacterium]